MPPLNPLPWFNQPVAAAAAGPDELDFVDFVLPPETFRHEQWNEDNK